MERVFVSSICLLFYASTNFDSLSKFDFLQITDKKNSRIHQSSAGSPSFTARKAISPVLQRRFPNNEKLTHLRKIFWFGRTQHIPKQSHYVQDVHVNVNWLRITALQVGQCLTLHDTLPQYEVFVNIRYIPCETRFSHWAKIKSAIVTTLFNKYLFISKQHSRFDILLFWTGSLCPPLELLCNSYADPGQKNAWRPLV